MKRIFWMPGIGLIVLIIIVMVGVGLYLGPIVKIGMEEVGPKVTQVSIKVDAVNVSLLTGSATVKGLVVGNPTGYSAPQAISVGTIAVSMDTFSAISHKVMVHSIRVQSPEITFEGGLGRNNLNKIMDNVNSFSQNSVPASTHPSAQANNKPAPTIEVDDFLITGAKVHVILPALGNRAIPLPDIHLTDLGKGSNGLTPAQLAAAVLDVIIKDAVSTVASSANILGQGVQRLGKGATQTVGSSVNVITNTIGGLFGK
jgi:hypothetical protein